MKSPTIQKVSTSELRCRRSCAYKHKLRYIERYRPIERDSYPLRFGSLYHEFVEYFWRHADGDTSAVMPELDKNDDPFLWAKTQALYEFYPSIWGDIDEWEVESVEKPFEQKLWGVTAEPILYVGVTDLILRNKRSGERWLVEHKTTSEDISTDDAKYWQRLILDDQITAYMNFTGVDGIIYDVSVRPSHKPWTATPVADRKFKKMKKSDVGVIEPNDPSLLYKNQRIDDETPEEFYSRVQDAIQQTPQKYFARKIIPRLPHQIDSIMNDLYTDITKMQEDEDLGRHPKNPQACYGYGRTCHFIDHCAYGLDLSKSSNFEIADKRHPEL